MVWDHFKDDRQLTRNVQEFYETIEKLIITYHRHRYYQPKDKELGSKLFGEYSYYRSKVKQRMEEFSSYLGFTLSKGKGHGTEILTAYMIKTGEKLLEDGNITYVHTDFKDRLVVGNSTRLYKEEVEKIDEFLKELRDNWKEKYHKKLFRPKIKKIVDFYSFENYKKSRFLKLITSIRICFLLF